MIWGRGYGISSGNTGIQVDGISSVFTWQFPGPSIMCYSQYSSSPFRLRFHKETFDEG